MIQQLFKEGKSFSNFPFRVIYLQLGNNVHYLQAGFSVSSKNFKKAVERNRIKRLMREAYRLQKNILQSVMEENQEYLVVFIIYTGHNIPEYPEVYEKTGKVLERIKKVVSQ